MRPTKKDDPDAHLAHFKTKEEYDNIVSLSSGRATWVGLLNPTGGAGTCLDAEGCKGILRWTDGAEFEAEKW